jgi:hypothetical protein
MENKDKPESKSVYETEYRSDYEADWDIHRNYINNFDAYEAMLISQVYDTVSNSVDSGKMTDGYATTLAKERADRVMAKLPDGATESAGKADVGKAMFMDILRQKWIYANANAQHPFLEKLNMWQFYSSVYGYMPMFYDWNVSPTGYIGPDCWLWNPRNLIPQQGRISIADMDYVTALTWVSKKFLEDIVDESSGKTDGDDDPDHDGDNDQLTEEDGWDVKAIQDLLSRSETVSNGDAVKDTVVQRNRTPQATHKGLCLATRYEAGEDGEWVTFAPENGYVEVRRLKNPHKNGRIPFVIKYSQPMFDSFYGLGDFQRAKPLQFARDGLRNFYFAGVKMNLIPPIVANAFGVQKHTLDYRAGGVMLETIPNSIRRLETSTAGLATYQAAMSDLTGSLLSQFGTQNASLPGADALNPTQGKTPQAINMYSDKEASRDGAEARHMETAIEQLVEGFYSLVANIGTEDIPVALFAADIQEIIDAGYADVTELFKNFKQTADGHAGELTVDPTKLKGVEYRFKIDPDSTVKTNKQAQLQAMDDLMDRIGKLQNVFQDDPGLNIQWGDMLKQWGSLTDIPGAQKFVTYDPSAKAQAAAAAPPPEPPPQTAVNMGPHVIESGDLIKLYLGTTNVDLRNAILQALQLPPVAQPGDDQEPVAPEAGPEPTVTSSGHIFNDPHVGAAADALHQHFQNSELPEPVPAEEPTPATIAPTGHMFTDPEIGQAAIALHEHLKPAEIPMPKAEVKPKGK